MLLQMALFQSFLRANSIPLYICTTSSLTIHLSIRIMLLPCVGYCEQCCYEQAARIFLSLSLVQTYAQEWHCWVIWELLFFIFSGLSTMFSILAAPMYTPTDSVEGFLESDFLK